MDASNANRKDLGFREKTWRSQGLDADARSPEKNEPQEVLTDEVRLGCEYSTSCQKVLKRFVYVSSVSCGFLVFRNTKQIFVLTTSLDVRGRGRTW